jgi:hypothetical protein
MKTSEAMAVVDADFRDQKLSDVRDNEIFKTVNDRIIHMQAIKEHQGQIEIQNTWFKEGKHDGR